MKAQDLNTKTEDELKKLLLEQRKNQMNMRFQRTGGQLEKTHEMRQARRTIARIKTYLTQKQAGVEASTKKAPAKAEKTPAKKAATKKTKAA